MRALQVSVLVATALLVLQENGVVAAPRGSYAYRTVHQASSSAGSSVGSAPLRRPASSGRQSVMDGRTKQQQGGVYSPVDYTPEVKIARAAFFKLYDKQAKLAKEAPDADNEGLRYDRQRTVAGPVDPDDVDPYYYYYYDEDDNSNEDHDFEDEYEEESHEEEDEEDSDDHEEESNEESDDEEDSHEEESDSDEEGDSSSSSSSEEDGGVSSSEEGNGEDSSEESSEESADGEDSSSSSSSEEDGDGRFDVASWGRRNTNALLARTPKPVTDTPEVKQEKRNFFRLYKKQAELAFNAPDH